MPATHFCVRVTACGAMVQTHYRAAPRPPLATYVQTVYPAHLHFVLVEQQVGNSLLDEEAAAIQWTHQCTFLQAHLQDPSATNQVSTTADLRPFQVSTCSGLSLAQQAEAQQRSNSAAMPHVQVCTSAQALGAEARQHATLLAGLLMHPSNRAGCTSTSIQLIAHALLVDKLHEKTEGAPLEAHGGRRQGSRHPPATPATLSPASCRCLRVRGHG